MHAAIADHRSSVGILNNIKPWKIRREGGVNIHTAGSCPLCSLPSSLYGCPQTQHQERSKAVSLTDAYSFLSSAFYTRDYISESNADSAIHFTLSSMIQVHHPILKKWSKRHKCVNCFTYIFLVCLRCFKSNHLERNCNGIGGMWVVTEWQHRSFSSCSLQAVVSHSNSFGTENLKKMKTLFFCFMF